MISMKQRRASYTTTVLCVIVFAVTLCAVPCPGADAGTKKEKGSMDAGHEEARKADEKLAEAKPAPAKGKDADNTNLLDFPNRMQLARADKESGNKPAPSPFRAATKEREVDLTQVTPRNTTWSAAATVGESKGDLAKQIQNPISDMISVPIQYNALFGMKPDNNAGHNLTIQPVIPIELNEDWNLINRPILTFDYLPSTRHGQGDVAGG